MERAVATATALFCLNIQRDSMPVLLYIRYIRIAKPSFCHCRQRVQKLHKLPLTISYLSLEKKDNRCNFENCILTDEPSQVEQLAEQFNSVWRGVEHVVTNADKKVLRR